MLAPLEVLAPLPVELPPPRPQREQATAELLERPSTAKGLRAEEKEDRMEREPPGPRPTSAPAGMAQDEPEPRLALEDEEEPDGAVEASRLPFGERPLPALGGAVDV